MLQMFSNRLGINDRKSQSKQHRFAFWIKVSETQIEAETSRTGNRRRISTVRTVCDFSVETSLTMCDDRLFHSKLHGCALNTAHHSSADKCASLVLTQHRNRISLNSTSFVANWTFYTINSFATFKSLSISQQLLLPLGTRNE